ncbi:MAG TPA: SAM-dependent methyltransferase [Micromonosporaceae bacterium]
MLSRTGQAVALMRADMIRPHTPTGDADAQRRLCVGMAPTGVRRPGIAARTRFFDEQVLAALDRGVRQVVVCGAGYDDRALRFRTPGVRFFELDHPATQADKRERLEAMAADRSGLELVPADFRVDDAAAALAGHGHDAAQPSVFLTEGLLIYLDRATGAHLLTSLRARATAGSTLVASLALHPPGVDPEYAVAVANAGRRNAADEPWRTLMTAAGYVDALRACGWQVHTRVDPADLEPNAPPGKTMLVAVVPCAS